MKVSKKNFMEGQKSELNSRPSTYFALVFCLIFTLAIYYNSLNLPFIFDDIGYIVNNPDIKNPAILVEKLRGKITPAFEIEKIELSRPLTILSYALNFYWSGLNHFYYHLFNIGIHLFNSLLIYFMTRNVLLLIIPESSKSSFSQSAEHSAYSSNIIPIAAYLIFSIHPINTEVVILAKLAISDGVLFHT